MSQTDTIPAQRAHRVMVAVTDTNQQTLFCVIDLRRELSLIKPLAQMAAAEWSDHVEKEWDLHLHHLQPAPVDPMLIAEAHLSDAPYNDAPLSQITIPCSSFFQGVARMIAGQLEIPLETFTVTPLSEDSPIVETWDTTQDGGDSDIEFISTPSVLILPGPSDFTRQAPPVCQRVIEQVDSWQRCMFRPEALDTFLHAAREETQVERHWAGLGRIHMADGLCHNVIEEIVPLPGEATRFGIEMGGDEWMQALTRFGDRVVGYLHIHPPDDGHGKAVTLSCDLSGNDRNTMHNINLCLPSRPIVSVIAVFGLTIKEGDRIAAHGFDGRGNFTNIQLETHE